MNSDDGSDQSAENLSRSDMQINSDDEFGVNDKYFDFKRYQYEGVDLEDIEDPDLMQELFPEQNPTSQGYRQKNIDETGSLLPNLNDHSITDAHMMANN